MLRLTPIKNIVMLLLIKIFYHIRYMRKQEVYKLFHLVKDNTSNVPEKVFFIEDELKRLKL